jgi:hypothetical protein
MLGNWSSSSPLTLNIPCVSALLIKMGICRRATKVDEVTLEIFTQSLVNLDLRAFQVAMKNLATGEREEGEKDFPMLGTILRKMDEARELYPMRSLGKDEIDDKPVFSNLEQKRLK